MLYDQLGAAVIDVILRKRTLNLVSIVSKIFEVLLLTPHPTTGKISTTFLLRI